MLATLAHLFKLSKREEVLELAHDVLCTLKSCNSLHSSNTLLRKLSIKLAQVRIDLALALGSLAWEENLGIEEGTSSIRCFLTQRLGTTFLPARVASWRYRRGRRSLEETLSAPSQQIRDSAADLTPPIKMEEDDDVKHCSIIMHIIQALLYLQCDVSEEVEEVLEMLLTGLRDSDSIVRWSAAKGVGRVTSRLPRGLANDVVQSLLACFRSVSVHMDTWLCYSL